jgi:hypothetical protein
MRRFADGAQSFLRSRQKPSDRETGFVAIHIDVEYHGHCRLASSYDGARADSQ